MPEILKSFTNTDGEDFEGMFHGDKYFVKAGESKIFTEKLAKHLAGQLAWKIAARNLDKYPQELIDKLATTLVGSVAVKAEEPKNEEVVIKEEPEEEEFVEIKKVKKTTKKRK